MSTIRFLSLEGMLLYELHKFSEFGVFGGLEQLKDDHFGATETCAFGGESPDGDLPVGGRPGRNGIGYEVDVEFSVQQIHRCLIDADMGFDTAQDYVAGFKRVELVDEFGIAAATKAHLIHRLHTAQKLSQLRHRLP